jgi:hypothetical protein
MAPNNLNEESARLQEQFISMGAKISEAIRDAVRDAADSVDASVSQRVGKSLVSTFTALARFTEEAAENTFKISKGLLDSEAITKQLATLEQRRLSLIRQRELAILAGIKYEQEDYDATLRSIDAQKEMLDNEKNITDYVEKRTGLVGKLAGAMKAIPGLNKVINAKQLQEDLRKSIVGPLDESGKLTLKNTNAFKLLAVAANSIGTQLTKALLDPAAIMGKIVEQFFAINKASVDLRRLTGQTVDSYGDLSTGAASAVQVMEMAAELTRQTGFNAQNAFSGDVIANAASLKVELGLAADEAGAIAIMAQTSGMSVDTITDSVVATTSAFNGANRSAISQAQILKDVAKTSDSIKISLGNNPKALADAASQARKLGVDLNQLDQIASSLLDFESSIENELEAQLLTGNQINLSKARELALNNDIEGVGKELFKNSVDIEKFGRMGRLGQEAQAKALGLTRDQLAKIAYQRGLDANMTADQAAAAADVNAEDMRRLTIQENFTAALNKLMAYIAPIQDFIGDILSTPILGPLVAGLVVAIPMLGSLAGSLGSILGLFTANTAAATVNTTAITVHSGAVLNLTATNNAASVASGGAARSFVNMGRALGLFGVSAAKAIPVLLSIAAVAASIGIAFAGIGYAFAGFASVLNSVSADKVSGLAALGPAFSALALGLASLAIPGAIAIPILNGLKDVGAFGITGTVSQEPIAATQASPQTMSMQPIADEIKKMSDKMEGVLQKILAKNTDIYLDSYKVNLAVELGKQAGQ